MSKLKQYQAEVLSILLAHASGKKCFLHVDRDQDALWVTDFPRFAPAEPCLSVLHEQGFPVRAEEGKRLWKIDLSLEKWNGFCTEAVTFPAFPAEKYTDAYALCRILFSHPADANVNNLSSARCILKNEEDEALLLKSVPMLLQNASKAIRQKKPEASCTAYLLACWLNERGK